MGINNKIRRKEKKQRKKKNKTKIRKIKNKKQYLNSQQIGPKMDILHNPIYGLNIDQIKKIIEELSTSSDEKKEILIDEIKGIIKNHDSIMLLSMISGYGLSLQVNDQGEEKSPVNEGITQSIVEFFQTLCLLGSNDEEEYKYTPVTVVELLMDKLSQLNKIISFSGLQSDILNEPEKQKAIHLIQNRIRSNTQTVRNWGYNSQILNIAREIYTYLDDYLIEERGFSFSNVIDVFEYMLKSVNNSLQERTNNVRNIATMKSPKNMVIEYHKLLDLDEEKMNEFLEFIKKEKATKEQTLAILINHYDLFLSDIYYFNSQKIAKELNIIRKKVNLILCFFSFSFGELSEKNLENIFLDNPVWTKPLIKDNNRYFNPIPQIFFSFIFPALDECVITDNKKIIST